MAITLDGTLGITSPDFEPSGSTTPTNGLFLPAANTVGLATGSTERLRIDSSGNLGLGVTPSAWNATNIKALQVSNGGFANNGGSGYITNNAFYTGSYVPTYIAGNAAQMISFNRAGGNDIQFLVAPSGTAGNAITFTQAMTLDASGNLGLGVAPSAWGAGYKALQVGLAASLASEANANTRLYNNAYFDGSTVKYVNSAQASQYLQFQGQHLWLSAPSGTAGNAITFTQAMTLDASGNLLVGQTARGGQNSNSFDFDIQAANIYQSHVSGASSGSAYNTFHYASTQIGSITQNGTTGVLYNTSSDQRLKTNIIPAGSAIQSILDFPVDQFDWISSGEHQDFGAVAQKAINVIPEMVSVPADPEEMWGIDWSKAVPRLIKTIQELTARLEALENKS